MISHLTKKDFFIVPVGLVSSIEYVCGGRGGGGV
jgi:hypothetical protein